MKNNLSFLAILFLSFPLFSQNALNVDLFAQYHRGDSRYSGSWMYVAPDGTEYALLGSSAGTAVCRIHNQGTISEKSFVPGPVSNWREITVIDQFAYVTTEGGGAAEGMQVIDLRQLPDTAMLLTTYTDTFTKGHIIQRDIYSDSAYVYVCGTTSTQGIHILDVSDPATPQEVGLYRPGYYIHDCHVNGDVLFAAAFYEGKMDVVDIKDKRHPRKIAEFTVFEANTHSSWLTEDRRFLYVTSEKDGLLSRIYNIEDLDDVYPVASYLANESSLVHNPYIRGDFAFVTHNAEGLRVLDIADPTLPVEVGFYDTYTGPSPGSHGLWSACPFLPSGKIIGGNREDGLYVWTFNNTKAGRIKGRVVDASTGEPLPTAQLVIDSQTDTLHADAQGNFRFGALPGDYQFEVSLAGYYPKYQTLSLAPGSEEEWVVELEKIMVSVTEVVDNQLFVVYPNPCQDICKIDLEAFPLARQLSIYNSDGKQVRQVFWENVEVTKTFNIQGFPAGLYCYRLSSQQSKALATGKFMVANP